MAAFTIEPPPTPPTPWNTWWAPWVTFSQIPACLLGGRVMGGDGVDGNSPERRHDAGRDVGEPTRTGVGGKHLGEPFTVRVGGGVPQPAPPLQDEGLDAGLAESQGTHSAAVTTADHDGGGNAGASPDDVPSERGDRHPRPCRQARSLWRRPEIYALLTYLAVVSHIPSQQILPWPSFAFAFRRFQVK